MGYRVARSARLDAGHVFYCKLNELPSEARFDRFVEALCSLWVAQRVSVNLFGDRGAAFRSELPMLAGTICFSVFGLWLLKQPMEMRTSAI